MKTIKTRKQGNSVMVTVPKEFNVGEGVALNPRITSAGIFYEFVRTDDFFDFDTDLLQGLIADGYEGSELVKRFKQAKKQLSGAMDQEIQHAEKTATSYSQEELEKEIGL